MTIYRELPVSQRKTGHCYDPLLLLLPYKNRIVGFYPYTEKFRLEKTSTLTMYCPVFRS